MSARYTILGSIAKGGMGSLSLARMSGSAGFSRLVAIKQLHKELSQDRTLVAMLVDEARTASRVRHANVIDTLDLVVHEGVLSLVLEYVEGESLANLVRSARRAGEPVPVAISLAVMQGVLRGLDAAHEARGEDGSPLGIVHRDVSPQNVLVGVDGVPRVIDFGVAKALGRLESTRPGEIRGKLSYMSPEQLLARPLTRQADVYSAGVVLWELLAGRRLFASSDGAAVTAEVLKGNAPPPSSANPEIPPELDAIVARATARETSQRQLSARELFAELEPFARASADEVGTWVRRHAGATLAERQRMIDAAPQGDDRSVEAVLEDLVRSARSVNVPVAPPPSRMIDPVDDEVTSQEEKAGPPEEPVLVTTTETLVVPGAGPVEDEAPPPHRHSSSPPLPGTRAPSARPPGLRGRRLEKSWIATAAGLVIVLCLAVFVMSRGDDRARAEPAASATAQTTGASAAIEFVPVASVPAVATVAPSVVIAPGVAPVNPSVQAPEAPPVARPRASTPRRPAPPPPSRPPPAPPRDPGSYR